MSQNYRMYAFVANLYLSEKQFGIQTGHAKGEMIREFVFENPQKKEKQALAEFLKDGKTWIILGAVNQRGVLDAYGEIADVASWLRLPFALFREDEDSMNCMATACCVLVPESLYDTKLDVTKTEFGEEVRAYEYLEETFKVTRYEEGSPAYKLIDLIKSHRLA